MTHRGRVQNGVIIADPPVHLAEGTVVEFHTVESSAQRHPDTERFAGVISPRVTMQDYHEHLEKKHA